jgi:hypothetical protein
MFTPEDLKAQLFDWQQKPVIPCKFDTVVKDSNAELFSELCRVEKMVFENALHFFVNAMRPGNSWTTAEEYVKRTQFPLLSEMEFQDFLKNHIYMGRPTPNFGRFLAAIQIDNEWWEQSALLETENEYILFHWFTSA